MNKRNKNDRVVMKVWYQKNNSLRWVRDMLAINCNDRPITGTKTANFFLTNSKKIVELKVVI